MRHQMLTAGVCLCACAGVASADVSVLAPSQDNTLYNSQIGERSNGAGPGFFVGNNAGSEARRGLVQFDLSSIPAGSTIQSVSLQLTCTQAAAAGASSVSLHRLLASWGEGASNAGLPGGFGAPAEPGDATWSYRFFDTTLWAAEGGDFAPGAGAMLTVAGPGVYTWASTPALVADVQGWLDHTVGNFGWLVHGNEEAIQTAKRFESRESTVPGAAPRLTITYTPIPAPSGLGLLGVAGLVAARRRR